MVNTPTVQSSIVVAALASTSGIGYNGSLPWPRIAADMALFRTLTTNHAVIMGRKTWDSLPQKVRPLPDRLNIILTKQNPSTFRQRENIPDSVRIIGSLEAAKQILIDHNQSSSTNHESRLQNPIKKVFIIGGMQIYQEALRSPEWSTRIYLTEIHADLPCDTFFDWKPYKNQFNLISVSEKQQENNITFQFMEYIRLNINLLNDQDSASSSFSSNNVLPSSFQSHQEYQYLDLIKNIFAHGVSKGDRTGTGTLSLFGCQMRFNLSESFPLLTTKRVFWRGVVEELLWFLKGSTNANQLRDKDIHIWDGNGSREFLDKLGFVDREEGDLGPVYGFQWRHFGAQYKDMYTDYSGQGVDQLQDVIHKIKNNPNDRRIIMTAWNPSALNDMALPPCHMFCQFYVNGDELSCLMYQRSCDVGLGVPFNIASYSLLTCMISKICNLKPREFIHILGDTHIYQNHIEALKEQITREPRPFPSLKIKDRPDLKDIDDFEASDFELIGYNPYGKIKMDMAV